MSTIMLQNDMKVPVPGDEMEPRAQTEPAPRTRWMPHARTAAVLALAVLAVGLIQFLPTFRLSYAYDDLDCLNLAADVLAGKESFWRVAFRPHNEHLMPLLRAAFHASAAWFGIDATPFRLAVFGAHLLTAWFLGLLALRYSGRPAAAMAAGLAYVLPCGLSSMIWVLVASGVPIGLVGLSGALLALAHRETLGVLRARLLAGAGCLLALSAASGLMPLLVDPLLLDELERRRAGAPRRRPATVPRTLCRLLPRRHGCLRPGDRSPVHARVRAQTRAQPAPRPGRPAARFPAPAPARGPGAGPVAPRLRTLLPAAPAPGETAAPLLLVLDGPCPVQALPAPRLAGRGPVSRGAAGDRGRAAGRFRARLPLRVPAADLLGALPGADSGAPAHRRPRVEGERPPCRRGNRVPSATSRWSEASRRTRVPWSSRRW